MQRMYIVRRGEVVPATEIDAGPLIYRNDELFLRYKRRNVWILMIAVSIAIILVLLNLVQYLFVDHSPLALLLVVLWSVVGVLDVWQVLIIREFEHGIGFHEKGIDILNLGPFKRGRLFIPKEEIFKTGRSFLRLNIEARFSNARWYIPGKLLDDQAFEVLDMLLGDHRESSKEPKLVVYSEKIL